MMSLIILAFSIATFSQTPQLLKRSITKIDRLDFGAGGTVSVVGAPMGSVNIIGSSKNEIEITAVIEIQGRSEAELDRLAAVTTFVTQESAGRFGVITVGTHNNLGDKKFWKKFPKNLVGLPFRIDIRPFGGHVSGPTIRLVHGNHALNTVYVTEDRSDEFLATMGKQLGSREGDVVCFGHTHKPFHRVVEGVQYVNTGSVGRPKDGDKRAGYVLLDVTAQGVAVEFVRVEYDVEAAARGIIESTLPDDFADFLRTGGSP